MTTNQSWTGAAAVLPGIGIFRGTSGNNKAHRHWAHQFSIGLSGPVSFESADSHISGRGLFIPAGVSHRQLQSDALSIYVDPVSAFAKRLMPQPLSADTISALDAATCDNLLTTFSATSDIQHCLTMFVAGTSVQPRQLEKLDLVIEALTNSVQQGADIDRAALAAIAGLSPGRFSHWFREHTGMPLRSYRRWLRIVFALGLAHDTGNLADAALTAGFSDQAHFTRAVAQAFGLTPGTLLRLFTD